MHGRRRFRSRRRQACSLFPPPPHRICRRIPRKLSGVGHCHRSSSRVVPPARDRSSSQRHSCVGCACYAAGCSRFMRSFCVLARLRSNRVRSLLGHLIYQALQSRPPPSLLLALMASPLLLLPSPSTAPPLSAVTQPIACKPQSFSLQLNRALLLQSAAAQIFLRAHTRSPHTAALRPKAPASSQRTCGPPRCRLV